MIKAAVSNGHLFLAPKKVKQTKVSCKLGVADNKFKTEKIGKTWNSSEDSKVLFNRLV